MIRLVFTFVVSARRKSVLTMGISLSSGTFVVTLLWALGGFTPFYSLVYAIVPGTKFFRAPSTIYYVVTFSVAVLAALGTQRAMAGRVALGYLGAWAAFGVVILLMAVTGGLTNVARSFALPGREALVAANEGALAVGAVRSLAFLLVGAALLWAIICMTSTLFVLAIAFGQSLDGIKGGWQVVPLVGQLAVLLAVGVVAFRGAMRA